VDKVNSSPAFRRRLTLILLTCVSVAAAMVPAQAFARTSRPDSAPDVLPSWSQFHNTSDHLGVQTAETILGKSNVSQLATGWSVVTGGPITSSPVVSNGIVYFGSADHSIYAVNATTGSVLWTKVTGDEADSAPAVYADVLYYASNDGILYALNPTTGATLWTYNLGISVKSNLVAANGMIYVATVGNGGPVYGTIRAISTSTHAQVWSYSPFVNTYFSPAVGSGKVFQGFENNILYALDQNTGALKWTATTGGALQGSATVSGTTVYVPANDSYLYAFDVNTGALKWKSLTAPLDTAAVVKVAPVVYNNKVYVSTGETVPMGSHLYTYDATTGALLCSHAMADYSASSAAAANGVIYVGSFSHQLYAFDADTCDKLWDSGFSTMQGGIPSSPAVASGWVYVGSLDGTFYAFDDTPGAPISTFVTITDNLYNPTDSLNHKLGNAAQWTNNGTTAHSVTDSSGMGLFDSGSIAPGGVFVSTFAGAGIFKYTCTLHPGMTGSIKAPMVLTPTTGSLSTVFNIAWAGIVAPAGYVYDVQIKRAGSSVWTNWLTGQTQPSTTFVADSGKGTYQFRARMKNTANGKASNYSAAKSITVS
jgi:outer membrane protein assembly factor BamB